MEKITTKFNHDGARLVISDYPEKTKKTEKNYGIAWYTKQLLEPLAENYGIDFVVLAEKGISSKPALYQNNHILVLRVFSQERPTLFPRILHYLATFNKIKYVDIHSEFCTSGGIKNFVLLPLFILLIKLSGKHITYFFHNVVTKIDPIAEHLGYKNESLTLKFLNLGLGLFYRALSILSDRFVVMDKVIYQRICLFTDPKKVFLIPFWVEKKWGKISKKSARKSLKIADKKFLLLYFGFITHYKGADWLISTIKRLKKSPAFKNIQVILAGGQAYSLKNKPHYRKYYKKLLVNTRNSQDIKITGFVPEKDIQKYFIASDLVVLPYRCLIGSSGVLTHTISYKKPFILSRSMFKILESKDIKSSLAKYGITPNSLVFDHTLSSFTQTLSKVSQKDSLRQLEKACLEIAKIRNKSTLLEQIYLQLYSTKKELDKLPTPAILPIPNLNRS